MNFSMLDGEEKVFLGRMEDLIEGSETKPRFSAFLTSRQTAIATALIEQRHLQERVIFCGGYPGAARQIVGVFPFYQQPDDTLFPICAVTAFFREADTLSHRDFLGSLMGLLIKRESIGDILIETGKCTMFFTEKVGLVVLQELKKVGNKGVRCEPGVIGEIVVTQAFDTFRGTVSSVRLDCLISLLTGLSREKSAKLIMAERVQLEHISVVNVSKAFHEGNTVVIQGFGKFIVDKIGAPTRKGRLPIDFRKYR